MNSADADGEGGGWLNPRLRARVLLYLAIGASFALFWWVGRWFGIPAEPGFDGSILRQPAPVLVVIVLAVAMAVATAFGTAIGSIIRFDAGLLIASLGLGAISIRGGTVQDVLLSADGAGVLPVLALEQVVLFAIVAGIWLGLWRLRERGLLKTDEPEEPQETGGNPVVAVAIQVIVMGLVLMIMLAQSAEKFQVLMAVGVGAFVGAGLAKNYYPAKGLDAWYWVGPAGAGLAGYVLAYATAPAAGVEIGQLYGSFAGLARALPLDYAAWGTAGALLGRGVGASMLQPVASMLLGSPKPGEKKNGPKGK